MPLASYHGLISVFVWLVASGWHFFPFNKNINQVKLAGFLLYCPWVKSKRVTICQWFSCFLLSIGDCELTPLLFMIPSWQGRGCLWMWKWDLWLQQTNTDQFLQVFPRIWRYGCPFFKSSMSMCLNGKPKASHCKCLYRWEANILSWNKICIKS